MPGRIAPIQLLGCLIFGAAFFDLSIGAAQAQKHPRLHRAIYEMEQAEIELNEAPKVFGGHKKKAIDAMDAAKAQLKLALEAVGENPTPKKVKEESKGTGPFPRISTAIDELKETKSYLEKAPQDFKGHKVKAMKDITVAIEELEMALAFAAKGKKK